MKYFLSLFIYIQDVKFAELQPCGKHKQSRFYLQKYKTKFGVQ